MRNKYPKHIQAVIDKWTAIDYDDNEKGSFAIVNKDIVVMINEINRLMEENRNLKERIDVQERTGPG